MDRFTRRILDHIADRRYRPSRLEELAADLGVGPDDLEEFERSVTRMVDEGRLLLGATDTIALPPPGREMVGTFRKANKGFGFVEPDSPVEHGDLFVPAHLTAGALTGDRVRAKVVKDRQRETASGRSPFIGQIVEIVQRASNRFVGNLMKLGSGWVVELDGRVFRDPVVIRDPHVKAAGAAKPGDKVVVELTSYPKDDRPAIGVITEILGEHGEPDVETLAVMRAHGLAESFSNAVLADARQAALSFDETAIPADREDLTKTFILTIDPPDAKDFDDAISIRKLDGPSSDAGAPGRAKPPAEAVWELGVHIAHVAHFVRKGTALDDEAIKRGNSTYLPRKVVPMLPEVLSNGVCSLQEGVNRFCLTAFLYYDRAGQVVGQRFARTVIRSAKRLTYLEAQALIEDNIREAMRHARGEPKYPRILIEQLKLMNELAQVLRARRMKQGMIVLDLPEVELKFDDSGRVCDAVPEDDAFTHKLIEMFMVEANEAAARLFDNLGVPMIRRIHPEPPTHDVGELRNFARIAGFVIPLRPDRRHLQELLESVRGKPAQRAVHIALLRTLARAEYSPEPIGHYALASEHYTHFTSPIRRYPDLIIHRGLDAYLDAQAQLQAHGNQAKAHDLARRLQDDPRVPDEDNLYKLGKHCSATERNSAAAESDLRTYLVLDLLSAHLGEDYDGTVTGVTNDGVYIQLNKYLVDGFVHTADLPGLPSDRWRINQQNGALVAMRSGKSIRVGDQFTVRIAKVNPVRRQLEMVILSQLGKAPQDRRANLPEGLRKRREEQMRLKRDRRQAKHKKRRR